MRKPARASFVTSGRRAAVLAVLLALPVVTAGCATYSAKMENLRPELAAGDFAAALETVEKKSGSKDRVLYYLERGLILHYAERYGESNEAFAAAERTADDLFTKSVSEGALSLLSNDNAISYRPRPFEMAMVPYYKALNYVYLGQKDEAQVEARRASLQLGKYVDATLDGLREEDRDALARIRNNAFLHYWSGLLYDWDGELNDAFIAYRNAAVAYQQGADLLRVDLPPALAGDLVRTADRLGFAAELEQVRASCPDVFAAAGDGGQAPVAEAWAGRTLWPAGRGTVVVLLEAGFVPQKTQVRFDLPIFEQETYDDPDYWAWEMHAGMGNMQAFTRGRKVEYWISVAAPELRDDLPGPIASARVSAGTVGGHVATSRVENLAAHARLTFDAEKSTIFFKTILRGLTKYLASRGAEKAGGGWAKLAANVFGAATESADTRSWLTLPEHVHLARLDLPPGTYDLRVELLDRRGRPLHTETIPAVEVRAGDFRFVSRRVF